MIQLLFVDDEPSVLESLEKRFRPWRRESLARIGWLYRLEAWARRHACQQAPS
jgi:hypothetical protein